MNINSTAGASSGKPSTSLLNEALSGTAASSGAQGYSYLNNSCAQFSIDHSNINSGFLHASPMFKNGRHSEFKITPHQSPMIIRGQNTIKDSMGGMEAIHSTTITSFLSKLGAHPTENNHQPLSLIHKQFDSLLSPAPTRA